MYRAPDFSQNLPPGFDQHTMMYGISTPSYIDEHLNNENNSNDQSLTDITISKNQKCIDESIIGKFSEEEFNDNNKKIERNSSKIAMVKDALVLVSILNKQIESNVEEMKTNSALTGADWQEKLEICNAAKSQIRAILNRIKNDDLLDSVKRDLDKRKKKRLREKNHRIKWKNEKVMRAERRNRLDEEANAWIRSKQVIIEKEKQEEDLRRHADIILSDVRSKRNDTKKFLGILQGLQTLRNVKTNIAIARGESLSSAASEVFNNIIGKLKEQWTALDREYSLEEQGLKLMLKTDNEQKMQDEKKKILKNWETVLFGNKLTISHPFHQDINNFIMIRSAWDKFINSNPDASPIPIGWVMPDKPSSAAWQKLLTKD